MKLLILLCLVASTYAIGTTQSAGVRGKLICNGSPAAGVTVRLYDHDRGLDADDLMASGKTNENGEFEISGHEDEILTIDPKLNIYHDCDDGIKPCQRKFSIMIPDSYVSKGKVPHEIFDAGVIQLAGLFPGESRECTFRESLSKVIAVVDSYPKSL